MSDFLIWVAFIAILFIIFGKTDEKRTVLRSVGLDFSQSNYESMKEAEFKKNCRKAMTEAMDKYNVQGSDEADFLERLDEVLNECAYHLKNEWSEPRIISVHPHFSKHAMTVIYRRLSDLRKGECEHLLSPCDFKDKKDLKKYIQRLWERYQAPWPENWLTEINY